MANQNIVIYAGDYMELEVFVYDQDNNNVDAQGITATYKVAKHPKMQPVITKDMTNELSINEIDGTLMIKIILNPADTVDMHGGTYYHEIEVEDSNQRPFTIMTGTFEIIPTLIND